MMKAVILAAGVASRLRPLTNEIPKCLLKLGQKTILERTIDNVLSHDINELIIVTGYLQEQIKGFIKDHYPKLNVTYIYNDVYDSTNNIYSLWLVKDHIQNTDILLMDSDIIFDHRIINMLLTSGKGNFLAIRSEHSLSEEEMKVIVNSDNLISQISKKIDPQFASGESIGIEKFESDYLQKLFSKLDQRVVSRRRVNDFYEAAFQDTIDEGLPLYALDVGDYKCIEIDTPEDIDEAEKMIAKYIDRNSF
jgi:choline kinase